MPTLEFKGKSFVYAHHLSVPFRELVIDAKKSLPAKGQKPALDDNLIIHGDNLHALKALLPVYAGKVDCIYIDPPYNTGNEGWCYNDNVRSPLMREWIKKSGNPVEKEDLERHDKWMSMMWPRLKLLHELLAEDGAIFISIDDNEVHRLRSIVEEIFGEDKFIANIVWRRTVSRAVSGEGVLVSHDHILCFGKSSSTAINREKDEDDDGYKNPDNDSRGPYKLQKLERTLEGARPTMTFEIQTPKGPITRTWAVRPETCAAMLKDNRISFSAKSGMPYYKQFLKEFGGVLPDTWWDDRGGYNQDGSKELKAIFGVKNLFNNPKPSELIVELMRLNCPRDGLILDSFAGSGTTAHAVLALNKKDGGNRKFILVETEDYADKLTAERVRRVIEGYKFEGTQREELLREPLNWTKFQRGAELVEQAESIEKFEGSRFDKVTKTVEDGALVVTGEKDVTEKTEGLGGSFTFATLGPEMTLDKLLADGLPAFESLAKYVFFTATGRTLSEVARQAAKWFGYIGETDVYRVHLHYKPDINWLQSNDAALTEKLVDEMVAANKGRKKLLVFAAAKFMSQRELSRQGVEFCQLPYAIHRILGD
jgi:adenine-specific DNA-methyltransferase